MSLSRKKLFLCAIFTTIFLLYTTYLTQNMLGMSEYLSEGLPLTLALAIIIINVKNIKINNSFITYLIYLNYLLIITFYNIICENKNPLIIIFMYQYIPLLIVLGNVENRISYNNQKIYFYISTVASASAVIGISQFLDLNQIIPIDINRARGLSRSTLNFSSMALLGLICATQLRKKYQRNIISFIIFLGILCSQSRGAIYGGILYLLIHHSGNVKTLFKYIILVIIILLILPELNQTSNFLSLTDRIVNGFKIENNNGNIDRLNSYLKIIDEFTYAGLGIGSTGPAAGRLEPGTGYESYFLAVIAQGGVVGIFFYSLLIIQNKSFFTIILRDTKYLSIGLAILFMCTLQQTLETPTVNIMTWFIILLIIDEYKKTKRVLI
jgi:hypothetical protein